MKKYWKSLDELNGIKHQETDNHLENISALDVLGGENSTHATSRRDFLKWCGFSVLAATVVSGCENPVKKAIPYLNKPEEITPGMPSYYATNYFDGKDFCSIIVKTREGRPIKIEGNDLSLFTHGGTHARVQASVLSLYDTTGRYHQPLKQGKKISWAEADSEIVEQLQRVDGEIAFVTSTIISPSTHEVIRQFLNRFPKARHISYDAISYAAMREANKRSFSRNEIPFYWFDKADLIIGFNADFLANWLLPVTFAKQYSDTRRIGEDKKTMSQHIQFESGMSVTGANADQRFMITPQQELDILQGVFRLLAGESNGVEHPHALLVADQIRNHTNKTLLVSGTNDLKVQLLVNAINHMVCSYGNTIDFTHALHLFQGNDKEMHELVVAMKTGKVGAVITADVNPVFDYPGGVFTEAFKNVVLKISLSSSVTETAELSDYILPSCHFLESWDDVEPANGFLGIVQPVIRPLFDTRQMQDTLLKWIGSEVKYKDLIMEQWEEKVFPLQKSVSPLSVKYTDFHGFWQHCLQQGVFIPGVESVTNHTFEAAAIHNSGALKSNSKENAGWNILIYESVALGDGRHANNPWLQELPDPVTKVCWDNYAAMSPADAEELGLVNGNIIRLQDGLEVPVFIQPGQTPHTISVALGYGRKRSGKVAEKVGINMFPFLRLDAGFKQYSFLCNKPEKVSGKHEFAQTQSHHDMEGRDIVRESVLGSWTEKPESGNEMHKKIEKHHVTLYPEPEFGAHHWALAVDLNRCTGCSNCVIACQAENNIPVIGKTEVMRRRIMHWMRIDRYYTGGAADPGVVFQPLMCQHCDNAPCENVCPVSATTHSDEGINQITYNRCVGTKYCINNCPYKVRRFNWFEYAKNKKFDYHMNDEFGRLVLNPDVTVRERGVVEKCSFCIQRIQAGKLNAKLENRMLADGDVVPACAQSCPSKALIFGDLKDPESRISKLFEDERNYHLLEELHTLPSVGYLTKIRNKQ